MPAGCRAGPAGDRLYQPRDVSPARLHLGIRDSGKYIGKSSVLLEIVPVAERPTYWGLLNSVLGIVSLLPVLAGSMIGLLGVQPLFGW